MKTKIVFKKAAIFLSLVSAFLYLVLPLISHAQIVKSSKATTSVKPNSLTLSAPASVSMNPIDVSADEIETTGTMAGIEITDLRGKKLPLGWSLTVTVTDFKSADNDTILLTKFKMLVNQYQFLGGIDGGITIPGTAAFVDSNNDGISDAASILIAKAGFGAGKFSISPILKLLVPAFTIAGDYQSTIVLTLS